MTVTNPLDYVILAELFLTVFFLGYLIATVVAETRAVKKINLLKARLTIYEPGRRI